RADSMYLYEDSAHVSLVGVHLTLFDGLGEESVDLTSETGEMNTRTEAMVARGNVVLTSDEGCGRIETEELHYDPRQSRIWSSVRTVCVEDGSRLEGSGFTSDDDLRNFTLHDPRGRLR